MTQPTPPGPTPSPAPVVPARQPGTAFVEGLAVDVVAAVVLAIGPTVAGSDFAWSRAYWGAVALLAAKTAIQTTVAYVAARKAVPGA